MEWDQVVICVIAVMVSIATITMHIMFHESIKAKETYREDIDFDRDMADRRMAQFEEMWAELAKKIDALEHDACDIQSRSNNLKSKRANRHES